MRSTNRSNAKNVIIHTPESMAFGYILQATIGKKVNFQFVIYLGKKSYVLIGPLLMTNWKFTKYLSDVDLENVTKDHVQRGVNSYFLSCFLICFTISPEKMLCFLIVMLCFSSFSVFQVPKSTHLIQTWGVQTVQMRRMWLFTRFKAWPLVTFCKPPS